MLHVGALLQGAGPRQTARCCVARARRAVRVGEHGRQLACAAAAREAAQQPACGALPALMRAVDRRAACVRVRVRVRVRVS